MNRLIINLSKGRLQFFECNLGAHLNGRCWTPEVMDNHTLKSVPEIYLVLEPRNLLFRPQSLFFNGGWIPLHGYVCKASTFLPNQSQFVRLSTEWTHLRNKWTPTANKQGFASLRQTSLDTNLSLTRLLLNRFTNLCNMLFEIHDIIHVFH